MKIQIDTESKTIKFEESVNIVELITGLKKIFPNGKWKEYKVEPVVNYIWPNPVIVEPYYPNPYPFYSHPYTTSNGSELTHN